MRKVLVAVFFCVFAASSNAQVRPVVSSLESVVASCDNVYVGYVTRVGEEKAVSGQSYTEFEATVTVTETLKGTPTKTFTCTRYTSEVYGDFKRREKEHTAHLWCNRTTPYPNSTGWVPGFGNNNGWDWPTMDYKYIRGQEAVTKRIKQFVKANPGLYTTTSIMSCAPSPVIRPSRGIVDYILPVCPATEGLAQQMLHKPEQFLPKEDRTDGSKRSEECYRGLLRREAMYLLSNFKSEKNIELVKTFLNDSSVVIVGGFNQQQSLWYWVRSTAYELLTKWGVEAERPIEDAPLSAVKTTDGLFVWRRELRFR